MDQLSRLVIPLGAGVFTGVLGTSSKSHSTSNSNLDDLDLDYNSSSSSSSGEDSSDPFMSTGAVESWNINVKNWSLSHPTKKEASLGTSSLSGGSPQQLFTDVLGWGNDQLKTSMKIMNLNGGLLTGGSGGGVPSTTTNPVGFDPTNSDFLNNRHHHQPHHFPSEFLMNGTSSIMNNWAGELESVGGGGGGGILNEDEILFLNSSTGITEPYFPYYIRTTSTLLCGIILLFGIIGNVLVPIVVWRNKDLRSSTNIFLVNLSLADLLILLVCMPPVLIELHSKPEVWVLGATMCKLVPFAELSVAHASVLTILAISLERYIAICRPLRANYTCTKHRAVGLCIAIWVIGFIATSPMLVIAQHKKLRYYDQSILNACLTQAHGLWSTLYFLTSITVFFFLPLIVLIVLYWVISRNLMSDPCTTSGANRCCNGDHPNMRARRQVVIMLATVVFFFFICLLPFRIFTVYIILAPPASIENMGQELYYNILYMCRVMLYFNSAINPVLYNVMSSKFRDAFFKVLGCPMGSQHRSRWLCRHLSRQSTFTTSSTLPTSSVKSTVGHHHHSSLHAKNCANGDSLRIRELAGDKNGHFGPGKHSTAMRATSGPYYPSGPKRQMSTDSAVIHSHLLNNKDKKIMMRANSVV